MKQTELLVAKVRQSTLAIRLLYTKVARQVTDLETRIQIQEGTEARLQQTEAQSVFVGVEVTRLKFILSK